jgi:hypothetical protein
MARKLKTFQTSLGLYDLAIAVPAMKAALEAWDAGSNLFHQGVAKETDDPDVVAATMGKPGVVLERPAGSNGRFAEYSDLPSDLGSGENEDRQERRRSKTPKRTAPKISEEVARPPPTSRRSRGTVKPSAGARRPPEKKIARGARRRRPKRRRRWTRPSASMRRRRRTSGPMSWLSRSARGPRTSGGKRRGRRCRLRCGALGNRPATPC